MEVSSALWGLATAKKKKWHCHSSRIFKQGMKDTESTGTCNKKKDCTKRCGLSFCDKIKGTENEKMCKHERGIN